MWVLLNPEIVPSPANKQQDLILGFSLVFWIRGLKTVQLAEQLEEKAAKFLSEHKIPQALHQGFEFSLT